MKTIRNLSLALCALALSCAAAAGQGTGTITQMLTMPAGQVIIVLSGAPSGSPACSNQGASYTIDGTTAAGKVMVSGWELAFVTAKTITVIGVGGCTTTGITDRETANYTVYYQ